MFPNRKPSRGAALRVEIDLAESGHWRPLAWNCLERPLAATCGHLRPLASNFLEGPLAAICGYLQPLERLQVAASGCHALALETPCGQRPPAASGGCEWAQGLLYACGHLLGTGWGGTCLELSGAATCGHSSGCKWLQPCTCFTGLLRPLAPAATCSQSSGCKWLQMAASGGEWLHAGRNTRQSRHLEKNGFAGKAFFFSILEVG